jgi:hypothetical protein
MRRLSIRSSNRRPALSLHRTAVEAACLVYLAVVPRAIKYQYGRSHIAYIGTTQKGVDRIAASAAAIAPEVLRMHGVDSFELFTCTCRARQKVKTWRKLERALLLRFREMYGTVPRLNSQGKNMRWTDETKYFSVKRIDSIIEEYDV